MEPKLDRRFSRITPTQRLYCEAALAHIRAGWDDDTPACWRLRRRALILRNVMFVEANIALDLSHVANFPTANFPTANFPTEPGRKAVAPDGTRLL